MQLSTLSSSQQLSLCHEVQDAEIYTVLQDMHPTKVPGLDDFSAQFYQTFLQVVGTSVNALAKAFMRHELDLDQINQTFMTLMP